MVLSIFFSYTIIISKSLTLARLQANQNISLDMNWRRSILGDVTRNQGSNQLTGTGKHLTRAAPAWYGRFNHGTFLFLSLPFMLKWYCLSFSRRSYSVPRPHYSREKLQIIYLEWPAYFYSGYDDVL